MRRLTAWITTPASPLVARTSAISPQIVNTLLAVLNGHICTASRWGIVVTDCAATFGSTCMAASMNGRTDGRRRARGPGNHGEASLVLRCTHRQIERGPILPAVIAVVRRDANHREGFALGADAQPLADAAAIRPLLARQRFVHDDLSGGPAAVEFPPLAHRDAHRPEVRRADGVGERPSDTYRRRTRRPAATRRSVVGSR